MNTENKIAVPASNGVKFGNSPITTRISDRLYKFLCDGACNDQKALSMRPTSVVEVPHQSDTKTFGSKFTLNGFECKWHECPFDTKYEADEFLLALTTLPMEFVRIVPSHQTSKENIMLTDSTTANYRQRELEEVSKDLDHEPRIKIVGKAGETKWLTISADEFATISKILTFVPEPTEAERAASARARAGEEACKPIRTMRCTCCGAATRGRQWHNMDTGYGLGAECITYVSMRMTPDEMVNCYGIDGINYNIKE